MRIHPFVVLILTAATTLHAPPAMAQPSAAQAPAKRPAGIPKCFEYKTLTLPEGQRYEYLLFLPPQYDRDPNHRWPVIVSLHGSGECGNVVKMAGMALPRYAATHSDQFPFILIASNCPTMWYRGANAGAVLAELETVLAETRADPDRVYLTGYSMGGFATWELGMARPDLFAALVPVCGVGAPEAVGNVAALPIWAFHGAADRNVPVAGSRRPIEALKRLGARPRYTEFARDTHEIWEQVYSDKALYRWLLQHRRAPAPREIDYTLVGPIATAWWIAAEADPAVKTPARVVAEIQDGGHIRIDTTGIRRWQIRSNDPPLSVGDPIDITWNGQPIYKGRFEGAIGFDPTSRPSEPAKTPASRPSDENRPVETPHPSP